MKYTKSVKKGQPPAVYASGCILSEQICKPGSVIIRSSIYAYRYRHAPATSGAAGQALCSHSGVAPDRVYSDGRFCTPSGELLPRLSTLTTPAKAGGRYISVALFLKSPSAGVTRYPRPMEPGLSSRTGFRHVPATVRRTRRLYCSEAPPESQRKIQRIRKGEASVTMPLPPLSLTLSPACRCTSAKTVHCR